MVTASRPSESAIATAASMTCSRVCRGRGPRRRAPPAADSADIGFSSPHPHPPAILPLRAPEVLSYSVRCTVYGNIKRVPAGPGVAGRKGMNAIEAVGLTRSFGTVRALDGLDLAVPPAHPPIP